MSVGSIIKGNFLSVKDRFRLGKVSPQVIYGAFLTIKPVFKLRDTSTHTIKGSYITVREKFNPFNAIPPSILKGSFLTVIPPYRLLNNLGTPNQLKGVFFTVKGRKSFDIDPTLIKGVTLSVTQLNINGFELSNQLSFFNQVSFENVTITHPSEDEHLILLENPAESVSIPNLNTTFGQNYSELMCNYTITIQTVDLITNEPYTVRIEAVQKPLFIF